MGLNAGDLQKVQNLKHEEVYMRIRDYYSIFIKKWNQMTKSEKVEYIFGNGRQSSVDYVDKSSSYLDTLKGKPSMDDSIDLAKNVIYKNLEYSYHDEDNYGIKMGAYAHYIINTFNNGKL
jgi:hypothetical protein